MIQQGTKRIVVHITKGRGGNGGVKEKPPETKKETKVVDTSGDVSNYARNKFIRTNVTHTIAVGYQVGYSWLGYYAEGKTNEYGDASYGDYVERQIEVARDVSSVGHSLLMGATYGASGGLWGAVIGATLMGIGTANSLARKYKTRERNHDYLMFKENNAISVNRARAGINLSTGRLR